MGWVRPSTARRLVWAREGMEHAKKRLAKAEADLESVHEEGMGLAVDDDLLLARVRAKGFVRQARARLRTWVEQARREMRDQDGLWPSEPAPSLNTQDLPLFAARRSA